MEYTYIFRLYTEYIWNTLIYTEYIWNVLIYTEYIYSYTSGILGHTAFACTNMIMIIYYIYVVIFQVIMYTTYCSLLYKCDDMMNVA